MLCGGVCGVLFVLVSIGCTAGAEVGISLDGKCGVLMVCVEYVISSHLCSLQ